MTYKLPINDLQMTYKWLTNDLQMTYKWPTNDLQMTYKWPTNDLQMSQILLYSAFFIWGLQFNILVHLMSGVYTHFGGHESEVIRTFYKNTIVQVSSNNTFITFHHSREERTIWKIVLYQKLNKRSKKTHSIFLIGHFLVQWVLK